MLLIVLVKKGGALDQTIQIDPSFGISAAYKIACVTNSKAMVTFNQSAHNFILNLVLKHAEFVDTLILNAPILDMILGKPVFTAAQKALIQQFNNEFIPFVQSPEFIAYWIAQLRVCSQTSRKLAITELITNFQNYKSWSPAAQSAVNLYFTWAPQIAAAFPLQNYLLITTLKDLEPQLLLWTPINPNFYLIDAFAYLVNLKSFCPCNDIIRVLTSGIAPDFSKHTNLILPAAQIHSFQNQVGVFCESAYPKDECTPRAATTLEFETEEESMDEEY